MPGQQGLNAGVLPDPGFTYANLTLNYSADTLKNVLPYYSVHAIGFRPILSFPLRH
jgi:hypothetical protein